MKEEFRFALYQAYWILNKNIMLILFENDCCKFIVYIYKNFQLFCKLFFAFYYKIKESNLRFLIYFSIVKKSSRKMLVGVNIYLYFLRLA